MAYKLGKKPAVHRPIDFKFSRYMPALPKAPAVFGFGKLYTTWGMLGNDRYGDCVFAGADHETMIWNKARHGIDVPFSPKAALSDYSAVTGFDPTDPNTDQGTVVSDAMSYRRKTGLIDANGKRHKIAAYVSLDPKSWDQLVTASYIFGAVGIGFEFPDTAWAQFDAGHVWDVTDPNAQIDGGHYIPVVGSMDSSHKMTAVTWGKRQELTRAFYETYNDEAWAMLSEEQIRSDGTGLHGFDLATLQADLAAL